ncbi:cell division protein FtsZ [Leptolinea sp. HRD-7]|jgi:cell division protein FtsZ|nr:cell division protein FtsZ [Leptolinea sp. HRD-7]
MIETAINSESNQSSFATRKPVLKVVGVGGGGSNAINRMIELGIEGIDFIAANTDGQALKSSLAPVKIQLGPNLTRGLGAGGKPQVGESAAEESAKDIHTALLGADMVFIAAGMGGGTGTGAASIIARVAQAIGAVTVAIVSLPFSFEAGRRQVNAREGLAKLRQFTDTLITVPNDRLLQIAPHDLPLEMAFRLADDVLRQGIQGISELVLQPGVINVDFAHVRQMIQSGGGALLAVGQGEGEDKARQAVERALHHPLLDSVPLDQATGIIVNFTGGNDLTFLEVADAMENLQKRTNKRANIIPGIINAPQMHDRVQVILIITGIGSTPVSGTVLQTLQNIATPAQKNPQQAYEPVRVSQPPFIPLTEPEDLQKFESEPPERIEIMEYTGVSNNLDVPAFIRRRMR